MNNRIMIIFAGLFSSALQAQNHESAITFNEDSFLSDIPIILSASRLAQPQSETPTAVTVITRDMIDASTAQSIPDLMRYVPGFQVGYYDANTPVVTYHGHADSFSRRIQILIDGRSVYVPAWGGAPWRDLPITLDEIEQIEVIRGPNAAAYGSNSFLAVISIKTQHAIETHGHYINVKTSDDNEDSLIYRFGAQQDRLDYRITVSSEKSDGFPVLHDEHDEQFIKGRFDFQKNDSTQIMFKFGLDSATNTNESTGLTIPSHNYYTDSAYQQIKWEYNQDEKNTYSVQYYYNLHNVDDSTPSNVLDASNFDLGGITFDPFQIQIDYSIKSQRHEIEFNHHYYPDDKVRFVWGASYRNDKMLSPQMLGTTDNIEFNVARLFGHSEIRLNDNLILNAGLMVEHHSVSGHNNSPLLSVIYHASKHDSFRLTSSEATRAPSVIEEAANNTFYPELTIGGVGICSLSTTINACTNPDTNPLVGNSIYPYPFWRSSGNLKFEKIKNVEAGYFGTYLNNSLTIDAKIFEHKITDLIYQSFYDITNTDGLDFEVSDFINGIETTTKGYEIAINYTPSSDTRIGFTYANEEIEDNNLSNYEELTLSAPEHSYGLTMFKKFDESSTATLEYFTYSDMHWTDNLVTNPVSYDILNLKFTKFGDAGNHDARVSLILRNLSGRYDDYRQYGSVGVPSIFDNQVILELALKYF